MLAASWKLLPLPRRRNRVSRRYPDVEQWQLAHCASKRSWLQSSEIMTRVEPGLELTLNLPRLGRPGCLEDGALPTVLHPRSAMAWLAQLRDLQWIAANL